VLGELWGATAITKTTQHLDADIEVVILRVPYGAPETGFRTRGARQGDDAGSSSVAIRYRDIPYGDLGA